MAGNQTAPQSQPSPVLKVTRFDVVSSFMIALAIGLGLAVVWLAIIWVSNQLAPVKKSTDLELIELPGGFEDCVVGETLQLESPDDPSNDPSLAETPSEQTQIEEMIENVIELSDDATRQAEQQWDAHFENTGERGSASGTGGRPLGMGSGEAGIPREQRWFIRFSDRRNLAEYARQLDYFGIELGALIAGRELVYVAKFASKRPTVRRVTTGNGEQRLYMTRQGSGRSAADVELLKKARIDVGAAPIFHFYPAKTEMMLAELERGYSSRPVEEIRRTYFAILNTTSGFRIEVTKQSYFE